MIIQLCSDEILAAAVRVTEGGVCEWGSGWGKGDGWAGCYGEGWGGGMGRPEQKGNEIGGGFS